MMNSKYYLLFLCICSIKFACLRAQTCPTRFSSPITDGVHADLIRRDSGLLLGIRVSWSWLSSEPIECFQSPEVQLTTNVRNTITRTLDSTSRNNSVEFNSTELDCNQVYFPRVRATISDVRRFENGNETFFGGSERSPPAILPKVCVGPSTSPQHQGRVNISWDPLLCHLQNGADVTSYIMQCTPKSTGVTRRIFSFHSHRDVQCSQEVDGLYSCVVAESLIPSNQAYSIQVAAVNNNGEGLFSNPVNVSLPVSSTTCTSSSDERNRVGSTTSIPVVDASSDTDNDVLTTAITTNSITPDSEGTDHSTDTIVYSRTVSTANAVLIKHSCQEAWIVMGTVVAVIAIMAGIVITILIIIIYVLWKRLGFRKAEKEQSLQHDKSEGIDIKECSAYGKVISPQTATDSEQPHIYESTT